MERTIDVANRQLSIPNHPKDFSSDWRAERVYDPLSIHYEVCVLATTHDLHTRTGAIVERFPAPGHGQNERHRWSPYFGTNAS